ncbi:MAG: hypothetical protein HY318_05475 [Armatimonadetes bacterium]|nr:hypothetical protein [Armatimonadota bacterium]
MLIQSTGFLESGDALRGTAMRMRVPLVCLITYRGYLRQVASGLSPAHRKLTPDNLSRPDLDSCALLLEPALDAWGVPYDFLHKDEDLPRLAEAFDLAEERQAPVAVLVTRETG